MSTRARLFGDRMPAVILAGAAVIGLGLACIIPDRDIQVRTTDINIYPVHFVEGIPLTEEARCACSATACECPMPAFTFVPPLLALDTGYSFCICGENSSDPFALQGISLYVEDQDEVDGKPIDALRAAALLDWDPTLGEPAFDYVAYRSYLDPRAPLDLSVISSYESDVLKRPRPFVRSVTLKDGEGRLDLCNGAGRPLDPGFHTLSIMVTDRQWFQRDPAASETSTEGEETPDGMAVVLEGVPDIAAGATYDIQTYVFECLVDGETCECVDDA